MINAGQRSTSLYNMAKRSQPCQVKCRERLARALQLDHHCWNFCKIQMLFTSSYWLLIHFRVKTLLAVTFCAFANQITIISSLISCYFTAGFQNCSHLRINPTYTNYSVYTKRTGTAQFCPTYELSDFDDSILGGFDYIRSFNRKHVTNDPDFSD